jgi:hypothetical protein
MDESASGMIRLVDGLRRHPVLVVAGVVATAVAALVSFTGNVRELFGMFERPEVVAIDGRWVSEELANPFDANHHFRLVFDLHRQGAAVVGNLAQRRPDGRTTDPQGILEATLDGRTLSFHTREQALVGSETVSFRDLYLGVVEDDGIRFTLSSDRPWGFPTQTFLATRE